MTQASTGTGGEGGPGKISWFNDSTTALGPSAATTPGIAYPSDATLGGYWLMHLPNGRLAVLRQIDYGPAAWTGRKYDFSTPALKLLGYTTASFPTDATATGTYLGKTVPAQYRHLVLGAGGAPTQAAAPGPGAGGTSPGSVPAAAATASSGCLMTVLAAVFTLRLATRIKGK